MSHFRKRAALVIAALLAFTTYGLMSGLFLTGSGGLGALSVGVSEAISAFLILGALVCLFLYWHRRQRRPKT